MGRSSGRRTGRADFPVHRRACGVLAAAMILTGCGGGGNGNGPDTTPPTITQGPTATARADTVQICWTTNEAATSTIRYGLDTSYGEEVIQADLVVEHEVLFTVMFVDTTYYYVAESVDAAGNGPTVSDGGTFVTLRTAGQLVREGWAIFESGDYSGARALFLEAQVRDAMLTGGWTGGGWASLRLGDRTQARSDLEQAVSLDANGLDAAVGLAVVLASLGESAESAEWCRAVLEAEGGGTYQFAHDASVTSADVRVILAGDYVHLLELNLALEQVQILDPSVSLDPADPGSWGGYPTFAAALFAEIERLARISDG
ncbi:MAG: hypothetical protein KAW17_00785 [Candidatus Eisenbacteria sp.]|nr:hypothetical protein [Candidatus Eisenbacteria bacterium]